MIINGLLVVIMFTAVAVTFYRFGRQTQWREDRRRIAKARLDGSLTNKEADIAYWALGDDR